MICRYIRQLLLFYYVSYIGIHCQYDGSSSLTRAACKQPAIKFYFLHRLCFIIQLFSSFFFFCKLILHLNASNNYTKYGTMTYLVTKCHYWPSQTAKDDGKDMDKQWRKRWRRRQKVGRRHPDLLPGREEHGGG